VPYLPSSILRRLRALHPDATVVGLGCVLCFFALLKLYSLNFVKGDEHMYFYMSLLVSKGKWPYRDFFFSHPPLQLYLVGALYKLFGYSLALSKAVPSWPPWSRACMSILSVVVWLAGSRRLLLRALPVHLRCPARLVHFTGANCALAFALAATYQGFARRRFSRECSLRLALSSASTSPRSLSCWRCCSASAPGKSHCACLAATPLQRSHLRGFRRRGWPRLLVPSLRLQPQQDCASLFLVRQSQKRRLPQYSGHGWVVPASSGQSPCGHCAAGRAAKLRCRALLAGSPPESISGRRPGGGADDLRHLHLRLPVLLLNRVDYYSYYSC